jgi:hypothetical protein
MNTSTSAVKALGDALLIVAFALLVSAAPRTVAAQSAAGQPSVASEGATSAPAEGILPEPGFISRVIDYGGKFTGDGTEVKSGFYPEMSNMITGAGWISVGPGYRQWLFGDRLIVDGSAAYSWRAYKMAQARFELTNLARSRVAIGSQVRWQDLTQITFFGEGPDTPDSDRSEYRMKSLNLVGYATIRPMRSVAITGRIGWLQSPTVLAPGGSFKRGNPDTREVFPDDPVFTLSDQPDYVHGEVSIAADTRDSRSHPTSGGLYRAAWATYRDRDASLFTFERYEAEAAQFVPVAGGRLVFALHGWTVGSDTTAGQTVPFYLEPSLGGHNTLRAYTDYRFHDRNMLVVNVEARLALFTHVDAAVFVDAGNVAPRFADLDLSKRAYGAGVRMHSGRATFARFDVAHGTEGWNFLVRLNDPLHLSRLSRRMATIPFVS